MPSAISQQVLGLATSTSPGLAQAGGYNILPAGIVFPYAGATAPSGFVICNGQELSKTTYPALYAAIGDDYATQINPITGLAWAAPSAGNFRVPDYTGLFLRGVGTPNGLDAVTRGTQQAQKTKQNGLTSTVTLSNTAASLGGTAVALGTATVADKLHKHGMSHIHTVPIGYDNANFWWNKEVKGQSVINDNAYIVNVNGSGTITGMRRVNMETENLSKSDTDDNAVADQVTITVSGGTTSIASATIGSSDNETRPINKGVNYIIKV
jgi:microcystin-dependent protein